MIGMINPGSGPVDGGTKAQARANLIELLAEAGLDDARIRFAGAGHGGRFRFRVRRDGKTVALDMPGLPLEQVRFVDAPGQNVWAFPRLYVDGNSWLWMFAVGQTRDALARGSEGR